LCSRHYCPKCKKSRVWCAAVEMGPFCECEGVSLELVCEHCGDAEVDYGHKCIDWDRLSEGDHTPREVLDMLDERPDSLFNTSPTQALGVFQMD
jgi:hypothetical protein